MTSLIVALVISGFLLPACTNEDEVQPVSRPSSAASRRDSESEQQPRKKDWTLEHAKSENVAPGVETRFKLYTHCGVDWMVDFDGSFWDAIGEAQAIDNGGYRGLGNPSDRGTMTLVATDTARYVSDSGVMIDYSRAGETRRISPCY